MLRCWIVLDIGIVVLIYQVLVIKFNTLSPSLTTCWRLFRDEEILLCGEWPLTVSKGGGLEVGVGPDAHGEFHPEAVRQMKGAGTWLKVNGEAIYGTRPRTGTLWSEGETVRYTRSKDRRFVYAILTQWPGTTHTSAGRSDRAAKHKLVQEGKNHEKTHIPH